jgi:MoxR-like ATPase
MLAKNMQKQEISGRSLGQELSAKENNHAFEEFISVISGSAGTSIADFIGKWKLEGSVNMKFQYGQLIDAFIKGKVILIDEIDSIP